MMKLKGFLLAAALVSSPLYALQPISGAYGGVIIGGSYMFSVDVPNLNPLMLDWVTTYPGLGPYLASLNATVNQNSTYKLNYGFMGTLGLQIGFRCDNFRAEGQFLFNANPVRSLSINSVKIDNNRRETAYPSGQTSIIGGLANFYYDFIPNTDCDVNLAPFVGFGVGYVSIQNNFNFNYNKMQLNTTSISRSASAPAGQVIAGLLYFLDDYSYFGLDCRLFSTTNVSPAYPFNKTNINYAFISGNLTFNGHFDIG
jgi:hypothetical protein